MLALLLVGIQALDAFGDPLPEGAVARLGTIRWRHGGYVQSVACSPDGRYALSGSESVALWDLQTGLRVRTFEGTGPVAFVGEGRAVSAQRGGTLALWELSSGRRLREFEGATGWIGALSVDSKGQLLLAGGQDETVRLWSLETGALLRTQSQKSPISSVALAPDGRLAATSPWKAPAMLWDVETGKEIRALCDSENRIRSLVFTPEGGRVVAGSMSGSVELREVPGGKLLYSISGGSGRIEGVAINSNGKLGLAANSDHTLTLWEMETGRRLQTLRGHRYTVFSAAFSPDARLAVSGAGDGTLGLWDLESGRRLNARDTHESEVLSGTFTLDGRRALTASHDQTVALWDWPRGKRLRTYGPTDGTPWSLALAPDGKGFFAANGRDAVHWDLDSGRRVKSQIDAGGVNSLAASSDGKSILCGGNRLHWWDVAGDRELRSFQESSSVNPVAFCGDGRHVLGVQGKLVSKWNLGTGERVGSFEGHPVSVQSIAVSPDGRLAVSGSFDGTVALWDLGTGRRIRSYSASPGGVRSLAFSPDGSTFATASDDRRVDLWDVDSEQRLAQFPGHLGPVTSIAFSPSGAEILSTSADTSALVWRPTLKFRPGAAGLGIQAALETFNSPEFERRGTAREAIGLLGEQVIEPLLQAFPPESSDPPSPPEISRLEERLESDSPEIRRKAQKELEAWGKRGLPWIRTRSAAGGSAELRSALQEARETIERTPFQSGDRGRLRAVLVLIELPASAASRKALQRYAAGPIDSLAAESARHALIRD